MTDRNPEMSETLFANCTKLVPSPIIPIKKHDLPVYAVLIAGCVVLGTLAVLFVQFVLLPAFSWTLVHVRLP